MNVTNNFMSTFPLTSLTLGSSQQSFNENGTNMPSSTLDMWSNDADFKNNHIKSMMTIDQQQSQDEKFNHSSQVAMSTVVCVDLPSIRSHDHCSQHLYTFDDDHHHQQMIIQNNKQRETTTNSANLLSDHFNDDEHCQICGDLASGWHCGAITCEACKKFFLRSISTGDGNKKYKCQRDFSCSITKRSRTQCQYCRFQKCVSVGMKPHESVGPKTEDLYKKLPCLVCGASASGIHFGAVTCEACKGFFRRSIKENAPERYHCAENNNCEILSTSKITCRACRFRKCIQAGMSMDASRIGRQSNLFKESIRQLQNGSKSMASVIDSARIASMAKRRKIKTKTKTGRVFAANSEIDIGLSLTMKDFIEKVHNAYIMHLKDLPQCIPRETVWWTMASQMTIYAQAVMNFCQKIIPGFDNMYEKYEVLSSCINSVIMVTLLPRATSTKSSYNSNIQSTWNYWQAESTLSKELNAHVPQLTEAENAFRSFETKLQDLHLDEKELSLFLLMIITRTNLNVMNEENKSWPKCQYECVQAFSEYTQARRSSVNRELPIEFYDIVFLVSQLRSLNLRISQCLMNLPWPYIRNLPSFFYRIYLPSITNMSSVLNSNYDPLILSPVRATLNSTNRYDNEFFSDSLNSNSIDISLATNNIGPTRNVSSNNETNFWTMPSVGSSSQTSWCVSDMMTNHHSCSSSSSSSSSNIGRFSSRVIGTSSDDITVSIRW